MANISELHRLLDWATEQDARRERGEPSEWDQSTWVRADEHCGTACCIAGKKALDDGGVPLHWSDGAPRMTMRFPGPDHSIMGANDYAQKALGLTEEQAIVLFAGGNDLDDLRLVIDLIEQGVDDYDTFEEALTESRD